MTNSRSGPKSFNTLLHKQPEHLQKLFRTADHLTIRNKILQAALPENLKYAALIRYFRNNVLAITVPSGMYATLFRMHTQSILDQLKQHQEFTNIQRLDIKVRPTSFNNSKKKGKEKNKQENENARPADSEAGTTEDKTLQETLERLAARVKNRRKTSN